MRKNVLSTACVILAFLLAVPFTTVAQTVKVAVAYSDYKTEASDLPEQRIQLDVTASQDAALIDDAEKGKVVSLAEGDRITWQFDVVTAGNYLISVDYKALPDTYDSVSVDLLIDGSLPFTEAAGLPLERSWVNDGERQYDIHGNQIRPNQKEISVWNTKTLRAVDAAAGDLAFYFTAGTHSITLRLAREKCLVKAVTLATVQPHATYEEVLSAYEAQGYKAPDVKPLVLEAEEESVKSAQSLYPITDRSSASITPYSAELIYYSAVGGTQWKTAGQWIEWTVKAEKSGLYELSFHFKQNNKSDAVSIRELYIDGALPFAEAADIRFPYSMNWDMYTCGYEKDGKTVPYQFYLEEGEHKIRLQVGLGSYRPLLDEADRLITELNSVYRKIVVVTGVSPDQYANYEFEKVIPDVLQYMEQLSNELKAYEQSIRDRGFSGNQGTDTIKRLYNQIDWMLEDTDTIATRLKVYREAISSLGTWRNALAEQPLSLDKVYLTAAGGEVPSPKVSFFDVLLHHIRQFLYSYISDYSSIGEIDSETDREITVWMNAGRDQAQILKSLVSQQFTPNKSIAVDLQIVPADSLLPALLAGTGPDVSIALGQTEPLNLALRNALYNLENFDDFKEVAERFYPQSIVPFEFEGGTYALPDTLSYMMLFYRTDVLEEIKLSTADLATWDSLLQKALPVVQKSGLTVGIPASGQTYLSMLYQAGGDVYTDGDTASGLASAEAIQSMSLFEKLYSQYKLDLAFDGANRFRSGEMPILLADYLFYNQLTVFAPEINGLWSMLPIPGIEKADGTIDSTTLLSATGTAIMNAAEDKEACWEFVKWALSADVQATYGRDLESVVGTAARYNTANIEAMNAVKWDDDIKTQLEKQRQQLRAYPQIAGGYMSDREFNFAFRKIVYENESVRIAMSDAAKNITLEILRKREEYGLD